MFDENEQASMRLAQRERQHLYDLLLEHVVYGYLLFYADHWLLQKRGRPQKPRSGPTLRSYLEQKWNELEAGDSAMNRLVPRRVLEASKVVAGNVMVNCAERDWFKDLSANQ
jgi:hypothetical protein